MATLPNYVQPGDVSMAAYLNSIVDVLKDHESRLEKLEDGDSNSNSVVIDSVVPSGDLRIGQELTIFGRNFGYSIGAQSVYFNSSRVTVFKTGSNDSKLIINIPDVPGVTEAGIPPVTLTVANFSTSDSRSVTLKPMQLPQQGNISLTFQSVTPTTINTGSTPTFTYRLESQTLLSANVTLSATISIASLQNSLQLLNANGDPLANNQITLGPGQVIQISVRTGAIPSGINSFMLSVNANAPDTAGSGDSHSFPIGTPIEQPDPGITTLAFNASAPPNVLSNNVITIQSGMTATIQLRAEFTGTDTRTYDVLNPVITPSSGWTAIRSASPFFTTPATYQINGPITQFPAYDLSPTAQASSPATVVFTLQRQGSSLKRSVQFSLQRG